MTFRQVAQAHPALVEWLLLTWEIDLHRVKPALEAAHNIGKEV